MDILNQFKLNKYIIVLNTIVNVLITTINREIIGDKVTKIILQFVYDHIWQSLLAIICIHIKTSFSFVFITSMSLFLIEESMSNDAESHMTSKLQDWAGFPLH